MNSLFLSEEPVALVNLKPVPYNKEGLSRSHCGATEQRLLQWDKTYNISTHPITNFLHPSQTYIVEPSAFDIPQLWPSPPNTPTHHPGHPELRLKCHHLVMK
jgi:hypothetical protein